jgi:hypothetical protein
MAAIEPYLVNNELACADAHRVAAELGISPLDLAAPFNQDARYPRFCRCQLGVFGYGSKALGQSKIVLPAKHIPDDIRAALEARAVNGRVPCIAVWEIAEQFKYPRLGLGNICEAMGLRVTPCQLGCF